MITIKPHHFVDIITAYGDGCTAPQPHPYGHAVHEVTKRILTDAEVELCMDFGADDICRPCIHNIGGVCDDTIDTSYRPRAPASKREWNLMIDRRWSERLGLREGDRLTARDLCRRIRDRAGEIDDIYVEIPEHRTAERQDKLRRGVAAFLGQAE